MVEPIDRNILIITGGYNPSDTSYVTDLQTAITQIGSENKTLIVDGPISTTSNITVPSNILLKISNKEAYINHGSNNLTINGPFEAGKWQVFSGTGTVSFGDGVDEIYSEWWGAVGDGSTDDTTAIQAAINQAASSGAVLKLMPKQYNYSQLYLYYDATLNPGWPYDGVAGFVKYKNTITIEGTTREDRPQYNASQTVGTILNSTYTGTSGTIIKDKPTGESSWSTTSSFHLKNLTVISDNAGYVLDLKYFNQHSTIDNVYVQQENALGSGILLQEVYFVNVKNTNVMGPSASSRGVTGIRVYNEAVGGGLVGISEGSTVRNFATGIDIGGHTYDDGIAGQIINTNINNTEVADYDVAILVGWNTLNTSIRDCYFEHTTGQTGTDTIRVAYGAINVSIEDCFLQGEATSSQIYVGYTNAVYGIFIKGNTIRCRDAASAYGIYLNSNSSDQIILNNRFVPNVAGSTQTTAMYTGTAGQALNRAIVLGNSFNTIVTMYTNENGLKIAQDGYGNLIQGIFGLKAITRNVNGDGSVSTDGVSSVTVNPSATSITSFPFQTSKIMVLRFTGTNTLVHSSNLQLRGGVDYTTTDGTTKMFYCPTGLFWIEIPNGPESLYTLTASSGIIAGEYNMSNGAKWLSGTGSPEGVLSSVIGSLYTDLSGSTNTTLYVKTTGGGSISGWTAK